MYHKDVVVKFALIGCIRMWLCNWSGPALLCNQIRGGLNSRVNCGRGHGRPRRTYLWKNYKALRKIKHLNLIQELDASSCRYYTINSIQPLQHLNIGSTAPSGYRIQVSPEPPYDHWDYLPSSTTVLRFISRWSQSPFAIETSLFERSNFSWKSSPENISMLTVNVPLNEILRNHKVL